MSAFKILTRHFVDAALAPDVLTELGTDYLRRTLFGVARRAARDRDVRDARVLREVHGSGRARRPTPYRNAVQADTLLMIALPMLLVGLAAVIAGPLLFPDETDYRV